MKMRRRRRSAQLPWMMAELGWASWETIARRTAMMAQGRCSPWEYQRMVSEKMQAAWLSGLALTRRKSGLTGILAPWHSRAVANSRRLRKK